VSKKSFELINEFTGNQIISIHNQEHPAEDELYQSGKGEFLELLSMLGFSSSPFPVTRKSSLRSYLPNFNRSQKIFLIHNTYIPAEDISFAQYYAEENNLSLVFCLCPNANLYIENRLPPVEELMSNNCHLVIGTDSYSSNWQLSIAKEMQTLFNMPCLKNMNDNIGLETVLKWATSDGAKALEWETELGSFEKTKTPGITLIANDLSASRRLL
jgi:cytosine/adenosine deaminase-related metal-dependent hydrolase